MLFPRRMPDAVHELKEGDGGARSTASNWAASRRSGVGERSEAHERLGEHHEGVRPRAARCASTRSAAVITSSSAMRCDGTRMRARMSFIEPDDALWRKEPFRGGSCCEPRATLSPLGLGCGVSASSSGIVSSSIDRQESSPSGSGCCSDEAESFRSTAEPCVLPGFCRDRGWKSHSEADRDKFLRTRAFRVLGGATQSAVALMRRIVP